MTSPLETILTAIHARLSSLPATALRGEVLPERVAAEGLLILRDGEPGEPEVTLSPLPSYAAAVAIPSSRTATRVTPPPAQPLRKAPPKGWQGAHRIAARSAVPARGQSGLGIRPWLSDRG